MRNDCWLCTALGSNAVFSASTGAAMACSSGWVADSIGSSSPILVRLVGINLLVYSALLTLLAKRPSSAVFSLMASFLDFAWVALTFVLYVAAPGALSHQGWLMAVAVAAIVLGFAVLQLIGIDRLYRGRAGSKKGWHTICFATQVDRPLASLWSRVRDVGAIHQFAPNLASSSVYLESPNQCETRTCTDLRGQRWREEIEVREDHHELSMRFRTDDPQFPFPVNAMLGGWKLSEVTQIDESHVDESHVKVWWEFQLKRRWLAPIILPLLEQSLRSQMQIILTNMIASDLPIHVETNQKRTRRLVLGAC